MSISTIITYGFGSFGSVNKIPTHGFDIGAVIIPPGSQVWLIGGVELYPSLRCGAQLNTKINSDIELYPSLISKGELSE